MELRVNDTEGVTLCEGGYSGRAGGGMFVVSLRMNARVLSVLFQSVLTVEGEVRGCLMESICERVSPFCPEVELQLPIQTREVVLFSAAIKCAMYYVACLKTYTL